MKRSFLILIITAIVAASLIGCTQKNTYTDQTQTISETAQKGFQILSGGLRIPTYTYSELQGTELGTSELDENGSAIREK